MSGKLPIRLLRTGTELVDRALQALATDMAPLFRALFTRATDVLVQGGDPGSGAIVLHPLPTTSPTRDVRLKTGSTNVVQHRLQRAPLGRLIVFQSAAADVYDVALSAPYADATRYLGLACSADVTVRLVVY